MADEPSSARQNTLVRGVSVVNVWFAQPVFVASQGSTVHSMDTLDRYQPVQFWGAGVHLEVTLGAAAAPGAASSVTSQMRIAASAA